jgi:hypothetical protein
MVLFLLTFECVDSFTGRQSLQILAQLFDLLGALKTSAESNSPTSLYFEPTC